MMKTLLLRLLLVVLAVFCMAPGCNGDVLNDSTFRLWCGDSLCDWKLEQGHVQRAPTWHNDDYGVELVDAPTVISQHSSEGSGCMEFSAVADVADTAQVKIQVDFDMDGVADFEAPIAETHWKETKTLIHALPWVHDLVFTIRKEGGGRSVLAEIRLQNVNTCIGQPIPVKAPIGSNCGNGGDSDCEGGVCCLGICSTCCSVAQVEHACPAGRACASTSSELNPIPLGGVFPDMCDPGAGRGVSGDPCVADADCASHACAGVKRTNSAACADGGTGAACGVIAVVAGKCQ
jgi:hypothetical protein